MKKTCTILLLALATSVSLKAQNEDANLVLSYPEETPISFFEYPPETRAKAIFSERSEALNRYPEELMESIISATDQEWVDYNTLGGAEKSRKKNAAHFERVRNMDKNDNYFELVHKLSFEVSGVPTTVIKFYTHLDGTETLSGILVAQFVDGRWQKTSHPALSSLAILTMRIKSPVLRGIVLRNSDDPDISEITERVNDESGLNLTLLEEEFNSWYSPDIDQRKLDLYKDPEAW